MNKTFTITGGLLISQSHLKIDIDALTNAINSIGKAFKETSIISKLNYTVYGCKLTQNGTSVELSEGMVFISDEFFIVDAATYANTTVAIVNLYNFFLLSSNIIRPTFKEGSKVVAEIRKAVLLDSNSVGTKLDTDVFSTFLSLKDRITIPSATTLEAGKVIIATDNEVISGLDTEKVVTPASLNSKLPVQLLPDSQWIDAPLSSYFINIGTDAFKLKYRKDNFGNVIVRGRIEVAQTIVSTQTTIFTLPAEYRVTTDFVGVPFISENNLYGRIFYDNSPLGAIQLYSTIGLLSVGDRFDINLIIYK